MKRLFLSMLLLATSPAMAQVNPFNPDFAFCNIQGSLAVRGPLAWQCLTPGTAGQVMVSGGPNAQPGWLTVSGSGTVTSVDVGVPSYMSATGGPITAAGTIAINFDNQSQGQIFASPVIGAGAPMFRPLDALDLPGAGDFTGDITGTFPNATIDSGAVTNAKMADMPTLTVKSNVTGTDDAPSDNHISAILDASFTNTRGAVLYRDAVGWNALMPGTAGDYLQTGGAGANPTWAPASSGPGVGTVTSISFGEGITSNANPLTVTGTVTGHAPYRNKIINGAMTYQVYPGASSVPPASTVRTMAKWYLLNTGANALDWSSYKYGGNDNQLSAMRIVGVAGSGNNFDFFQRIESYEIAPLVGGDVTLSAVFPNGVGNMRYVVNVPSAVDDYASSTQIATGTFALVSGNRYAATFALPNTAYRGVEIRLRPSAAIGAFDRQITDVQLEAGSIPTPYEREPVATTQNRVSRYQQVITTVLRGYAGAAGAVFANTYNLTQPMRIPPNFSTIAHPANLNCAPSAAAYTNGAVHYTATSSAVGQYHCEHTLYVNADIP